MSIVKFQDITHKMSDGPAPASIDTATGHVFDAAGNTIGRWSPSDTNDSQAMADYAHDYAVRCCAASVRFADPERAEAMLQTHTMSMQVDDETVLMDLAPSDVHIPAAVPNFASGYRNRSPMADVLSPPLLQDKQSNKYWQFAKEDAFQRAVPSGGGGGGGTAGEIQPRIANATYSTIERALGGFVSTQVEANSDAPLKILQATTKRVMNALILEREIRTQALFRTSGNWNSAQVTTILAGSQWNGGANSDPVKDIHNMIEASYGDLSGLLFPMQIWNAFTRNPAVRGYYGFKDGVSAMPSAQEISKALNLPPIYVSGMQYIDSTGALKFVWGNDVVGFRMPDESPPTTQDDVATSYTFRWMFPNVPDGKASGGFVVRQFFDNTRGTAGGNKIIVIHNDDERFTSKFIGGLLINAFQ